MGRLKRDTLRSRIKKSLLEQLKNKGADIALFSDMIDDYMSLWDLKEMLQDDIRDVGLRTRDGRDSSSPKQLPIVNRQMLAILKEMKITTEAIVKAGEDIDAL